MGCSASVPTTAPPSAAASPTPQELKAQESAKRIAEMMAELGIDPAGGSGSFRKALNKKLIAALQRQWYGCALGMPEELFTPYLKATVALAAADGLDVSETKWCRNRTMLLGLSPQQSTELLSFDYRAAAIEPILESLGVEKPSGEYLRRLIFYDACTMASQDGFSLDEKVRSIKAAELLKISERQKDDIQDMVAEEEQLQKRKAALFEGLARPVGRDRENRPDAQLKRAAMQRLCYGVEVPLNEQLEQRYVSTLLAVAGADGLSAAEETWVRDRVAIFGLPPQSVESALSSADVASTGGGVMPAATGDGSNADVSAPLVADKAAAVAMLLDATLLAAQDGLSSAETERSAQAAAQLGLEREAAMEVRAIALEEQALVQKKLALFGSGTEA